MLISLFYSLSSSLCVVKSFDKNEHNRWEMWWYTHFLFPHGGGGRYMVEVDEETKAEQSMTTVGL